MKIWNTPPAKKDVELEVKRFFSTLQQALISDAEAMIAHSYDDWESQIWFLWQDTYVNEKEWSDLYFA